MPYEVLFRVQLHLLGEDVVLKVLPVRVVLLVRVGGQFGGEMPCTLFHSKLMMRFIQVFASGVLVVLYQLRHLILHPPILIDNRLMIFHQTALSAQDLHVFLASLLLLI